MITRVGGGGGGRAGRCQGGVGRTARQQLIVWSQSGRTEPGTPHTRSVTPPHCAAADGEVTMVAVVLTSCAVFTE